MTRKFSEGRRRAFVRALGESGNQTLSAERVKVSRSWVTLQRSRDKSFDAACRDAIAAAKARFDGLGRREDAGRKPPAGWGFQQGVELVVSGTRGRRTQVRRARIQQWTAGTERRFLDALATTCNVQAACEAVGLSKGSAYSHRRRWPAFERAWDEAVETAYAQLESALVLAARNLFADQEPAIPGPLPDMTAAQAIHLLHMHKHHVHGVGEGPHKRRRSSLPEATERLEKVMRAMRLLPDEASGREPLRPE